MRTVVLRLTAQRVEKVSKVLGPYKISLSLSDLSMVPLDSIIFDSNGIKGEIVSIDVEAGILEYLPTDGTLTFTRGSTIVIESSFRFATQDILLKESDLHQHYYEGRLSVTDINEAFGSFIEKTQVISNANIQLNNADRYLSNIFHNYNLTDKTAVNLYYGDSLEFRDYNLFFAGITNKFSNFHYNDEIFTFSAKDNRSIILETKIPNTIFNANQYPDYETYDVNSPIISIEMTTTPPGDWAKNTPIRTKTGTGDGSARITHIIGNVVYLSNYTGTFVLNDVVENQISGTTATIIAAAGIVSPLGTNLALLGDTGHGIGTIKDESPIVTAQHADIVTILNAYARRTYWGGFANWEPIYSPYTLTYTSTDKGLLDNLTFIVSAAQNFSNGSIIITTPEKVTEIPAQLLVFTGNKNIDLRQYNIKVNIGDVVTVRFSAFQIGSKETDPFLCQLHSIILNIVSLYSQEGSLITEVPIDFTGITTPADGVIYFNKNSSLVQIGVEISINNGTTWTTISTNINSNTIIPYQLSATNINKIRYTINFFTDTSFVKSAELYSVVVKFGTDVVKGTKLEESKIGLPIPILYGDYSDTLIPTILLDTIADDSISSGYGFTKVTLTGSQVLTNALNYTKGAGDKVAKVGDMIRFELDDPTLTELVYAKITGVEDFSTTGTIYFEDFGFIPITSGTVPIISRETNLYKICSNAIQSITGIKYLPKNAKEPVTLVNPLDSTVIQNLASGEFSINGVNSKDDVFVYCKGKEKDDGTLIESPLDILTDLVSTYLEGLSVSISNTDLGTELGSIKLRKYISEETTFGELLETIQINTNTHIRINTRNVLEILRFTSSILPTFSYLDSEVLPGSLEELYDPDSIVVSGMQFLYNFNPRNDAFLSLVNEGTNASDNTMELDWLWQTTDAILIADQTFKLLYKVPEVIHCILLEKDALKVKLGDIIKISYRDEEHIIFCYQVIKRVSSGELEIYGWNIANNYDFDFPYPTIPNFPVALLKEVNWNSNNATYTPYSIINPFFDTVDKTIDISYSFPNIINTLTNQHHTYVTGTPREAKLGNTIEISPSTANYDYGTILHTDILFDAPISFSCYLKSDTDTAYAWNRLIVGFISSSDIVNLTGQYSNDSTYLAASPPIDISNKDTTLTKVSFTDVAMPTGYDTLIVLLYSRTTMFFIEPYLYYSTDRNKSYTLFSYWNPTWPLELKNYVLDRYIPKELPPNKAITDIYGNTEFINKGF